MANVPKRLASQRAKHHGALTHLMANVPKHLASKRAKHHGALTHLMANVPKRLASQRAKHQGALISFWFHRFIEFEIGAFLSAFDESRLGKVRGGNLFDSESRVLRSAIAEVTACRTTLTINENPIKKVNESKFLGVLIDKEISWRGHINRISNKIRQTVGIIGRARGFMNGAQLLLLYNTMVLPHLQYCLLNWGNFKGDGNLGLSGGILSLQKSLVRIIATSNNPVSHTDPLFAKFAVLKIDGLYEQRLRVFAFKLFRGMLPSGVASLFKKVSHSYNTRGARSNLYIGCSDSKSLIYIAPKCWNSLPSALKASPSINSFKD